MKMLQQVLRSSSDSGCSGKRGSTLGAGGNAWSNNTVYARIVTPKNGRRQIGAVAFVVTDLEHSTAMSNTDGVAFRELQILHDNVRLGDVCVCALALRIRLLLLFSLLLPAGHAGCANHTHIHTSKYTLTCAFPPQLLRDNIERFGGYEVQTQGDSFVIAFASVLAAVNFCTETQYDLLHLQWPGRVLQLPSCKPVCVAVCVVCGFHPASVE